MSLRARLYYALEPKSSDRDKLSTINRILVILVLSSFVLLALETEDTLRSEHAAAFDSLNLLLVVVFAIEYICRLWAAGEDPKYRGFKGRLRYAFSFYAIADLAAFLPELILMLVVGDQVDRQLLALLKAFRLFRLFKLARYVPAFDLLGEAMKKAGSQLLTSFFLAMALVYISAIALYLIEGENNPEGFGSIPRAIWWAIATLTTVGYGDVYPETTLGRVAASFIALAGIGVVALPAGVFASAFSDVIRDQALKKQEEKARRALTGQDDEPSDEQA